MSHEQIIKKNINTLEILEPLMKESFISSEVNIDFTIFSGCEAPYGQRRLKLTLDGDHIPGLVTYLINCLRYEVSSLSAHIEECKKRDAIRKSETAASRKKDRADIIKRAKSQNKMSKRSK